MLNKTIVLHACCAICSGYPISYLQYMGYSVVVYFYNPNIYPAAEYKKRLEAQKILCKKYDVILAEAEYSPEDFYKIAAGYENEPERGTRCEKCFELRLEKTAEFACNNNINEFTTSIAISPHKNYTKLTETGKKIAVKYGLKYLSTDFRKKDGFLKTNKISRELHLYRQNYCGCEFSIAKSERNIN